VQAGDLQFRSENQGDFVRVMPIVPIIPTQGASMNVDVWDLPGAWQGGENPKRNRCLITDFNSGS
jgi:hypothetical protein